VQRTFDSGDLRVAFGRRGMWTLNPECCTLVDEPRSSGYAADETALSPSDEDASKDGDDDDADENDDDDDDGSQLAAQAGLEIF
jgi:hypothetical protein